LGIGGLGLLSKLRPIRVGHLRLQIPHPMREAAPPLRAGEALLDRADQARRSVRRDEERIAEASLIGAKASSSEGT
jgi:hypothetical protein